MKKLIDEIEKLKLNSRECFFLGITLFLLGVLVGMLLSPKGKRIIGSNNGNNNTGYLNDENK